MQIASKRGLTRAPPLTISGLWVANKLPPLGGDYFPGEADPRPALDGRRGIAQVLAEPVAEGWLTWNDTLTPAQTMLHENVWQLFRLEAKSEALKNVGWLK